MQYLLNLSKVCFWLSRAKAAPSHGEKVQRAAVSEKGMLSEEATNHDRAATSLVIS